MINFITTASENFFQHQIGTTCIPFSHESASERTILAYIDIRSVSNSVYRVYIAMGAPLLSQITELFLGEENPDEDTLKEMLLETTNMIVGSAKVLAEDSGDAFSIETPLIEQHMISNLACHDIRHLKIDNHIMTIAMKEL